MKQLKFIIFMSCLALAMRVSAQGITSVSGTVSDSYDVLMGVQVVEIDAANRIVSSALTDMNGNFVLKVRNPKNKIRFSYMGMKTVLLPINKKVYKVQMEDNTKVLGTVDVVAKKKMQTSGLAIPEREVSFAAQTINAKEFEGLGFTSIDEALQGRISGLDIVLNSGDLGAGTSMRLRGASTISSVVSNEPLIVVNGNVMNVDQTGFDVSTANEESFAQLLNVNPEDIEDIKVMKDAAATAIWGSQGANGVIEIRTKRGHRGKPTLTYTLRMTGTYQPKGIDLLTGDQYTMLLKEAYFNPTQSDMAANIRELNYESPSTFSEAEMFNENTDWVKEVTQFGLRQQHYVAVEGGDEKAVFRISGGYDHETGSIIKQKLDRFSTRMALDYYVNDRIKIASNFSLTYTDNERNSDNLLSLAYRKMPNLAIYEQDRNGNSTGRYYQMLQGTGDGDYLKDQRELVNPIASAHLAKNELRTYDIVPELILEYDLLGTDDDHHRLKYEGRVLMNIFNSYTDTDYPRELSTQNYQHSHAAKSASSKSLQFTTTHSLVYTPHFRNEDHFFTALGRFQLVSGSNSGLNNDAYRLPDGIEAPSLGRITGVGSYFGQWRSLYYTFSAHYAFKSRYIFDVSARMDATTKFGPSKRWGVFPAVSGRWNISDEPWMKWSRKWLSMLSVRPGWGLVGSQPNRDYLYINTYSNAGYYLGAAGMKPNGIKLNDLSWESKYTWNVGFDLGFWDNKLTMDINLYTQLTKNMLMGNAAIPGSTGFGSLAYKNVGDMRNRGWEFNINARDILKKGKFSMDVNVTFANNHNVIKKMDAGILASLNSDFEEGNAKLLQRVQIDNPFGAIYGYRYQGVYQYNYETFKNMTPEQRAQVTAPVARNANGEVILDDRGNPLQMRYCYNTTDYKFKGGDAMYEDVNHDGNIDQLDIVYLGNSLPKLTGGFGFRLKYARWQLNAQFNYRIDYDIVNMARLNMESMSSNNNQSQAVNYRWRKEGDVTSIPRAMTTATNVANFNTLISDRFVEDGTFLRLNYLQVSYSFDTKKIQKWGLNKLSFYANANNLFCLTKYTGVDPEVAYGGYSVSTDNAQTPRSKSYTLGISVGF
ncbi:MAG: SusC/RagA family TonB-linked outer membrane protein [Paraprevotella sp.]|jgi:tonB-linked outer membrane protein, susC/ragA family|nr:SusC/RagA family TonB-linked outer membrane protein [Paraprevotella sp.]